MTNSDRSGLERGGALSPQPAFVALQPGDRLLMGDGAVVTLTTSTEPVPETEPPWNDGEETPC